MQDNRLSEWFVPKFGPRNFRLSVGILFLPYTGMVVSFAIWGSLSVEFNMERLVYIGLIYFLALGVSAHCLDALGGKAKPWGRLPVKKIWLASMLSLAVSFSIGLYFAFSGSWLLIPIGIVEGFFLFAYNLELFGGKFHNNSSFVVSWGILPVFAGAVIHANSISIDTLILSAIAGLASYVLITTSRKYKLLKQQDTRYETLRQKETILKLTSSIVIGGTILFFILIHMRM